MERAISADALETEIRALAEKHFAAGQIEFANGVLKTITRVNAAPSLGTVEHLSELVKAESEGWLALLSIPMLPMVIDEGDSDVYCPRCGYDLSGGWNKYHPDQGWTMCQCPDCGQSIFDTKVMTRAEAEAALRGGGE